MATWTTLIGDVKIRRGCWCVSLPGGEGDSFVNRYQVSFRCRYYEVRVLNGELCQIGWVRDGFEPDEDGGVGDDERTSV